MSDLFPNAPLVSSIFQLRYAGETAVEIGRVAFQDATRDRLPKLYVPKAVSGQAPALQGVTFRSEDEAESIELAINSFTYYTSRYGGFADFKQRIHSYYQIFSKHVQLHRLTRVGLRYINHIPILRASPTAAIPLQDYLNVGITLPVNIGAELTELNTAFTVRMGVGKLRIVVQHQVLPDRAREILLLDFDFAQEDALEVMRVEEYLDRAHEYTKQVFMNLISERYLPIIKGETS